MDIVDQIVENKQAIIATCKKYGATNIRVFGSCARDDYHKTSDIDVLIDVPVKPKGWDYFYPLDDIADELSALLNHKVDVWTPDLLKPTIRKNALKEAVTLQ